MFLRSPPIKVMSDAAIATSVPVPMAMPRSAPASAGASLMPSPTIATAFPDACSPSPSPRRAPPAPDGAAEVRPGERRRVIDAVPHHRHGLSGRLQLLHLRRLLPG